MTTEKILEMVRQAQTDYKTYEKLVAGLEEMIRSECAKSSGAKNNEISIVKRLMKLNSKVNKYNKAFNGYSPFEMFTGTKYSAFVNQHYILCAEKDFGYSASESPFQIDRMINKSVFDSRNHTVKVDITDVKAFAKINKGTTKPYVISNEEITIGFNPQYLIDGLEFCKTDTFFASNPKAPIIIMNSDCVEDSNRLAFICPVNINTPKKEEN